MSEKIPAARVSLTEMVQNIISREWYRFFNDLFVLTGSGSNNISLVDVQTSPIAKEQPKSRSEILPYSATVGASPSYYMNATGHEIDAIVVGGTVSDVQYSRDGITFYSINIRAMVRLSPNDWIGIIYSSSPSLIIIPR